MPAVPSNRLAPRKQVRVRLRGDLSVTPQKYEGKAYHVVKDPVSLRYFRFTDREHALLRLLNGQRTLEEARKQYEEHHRPERLSLEEVEAFARMLLQSGLAQSDAAHVGAFLFERRQQERRRKRWSALVDLLYIQVPLFDPDRLLGRLLGPLRWVFTTAFLLTSLAGVLAAVLSVTTHFAAFRERLPSMTQFFSVETIIYLWLSLGAVKVLHEFGHGLCCKAFGGEVHEMGLMFLFFSPCLYCNVTDAWKLPDKWRRVLISLAGIYAELLVAALATFLWWHTPSASALNHFCLCLMAICGIGTVLFNGNPLMRSDGYYALADWLEVPNLRERAGRALERLLLEQGLGMDVSPEPGVRRRRRVLFLSYAAASQLYRWAVTFGILWFLNAFLRSQRLGAVGGVLLATAAGTMIGRPLVRVGQRLNQPGRLPLVKPLRPFVTASVLAVLVLVALLVPVPVSRVRQTAVIQLSPDAQEQVFVVEPGILERLYVQEGQQVQQGDVLAEFRSLEAETRLDSARGDYEIQLAHRQSLLDLASRATDADERAQLDIGLAAAGADCTLAVEQVRLTDQMLKRLVLRAPRAGIVLGPPRIDAVGRYWQKDDGTPFCVIGDQKRLRALVPVPPEDYQLLHEELDRAPELSATVRIRGTGARTWPGRIAHLPESEAAEVPRELTTRGSGPLAADPSDRPGVYVPRSQQYLVAVDLCEVDDRVYPGALAQVKIPCRWRPCAWWLWRAASATFDIGL